MTPNQISQMFGSQLPNKTPSPFVVHNWRSDVVTPLVMHRPVWLKWLRGVWCVIRSGLLSWINWFGKKGRSCIMGVIGVCPRWLLVLVKSCSMKVSRWLLVDFVSCLLYLIQYTNSKAISHGHGKLQQKPLRRHVRSRIHQSLTLYAWSTVRRI